VYLSDYDEDFEGGLFEFTDKENGVTLRPRKGALLTFSSGIENPHRVTKVTKGERLAWSLWFTCNPVKQFLQSRLKLQHDEL
jgi:predicted 2-oxoglutarate/Fe(II)-dependent dioxygenase YbiX